MILQLRDENKFYKYLKDTHNLHNDTINVLKAYYKQQQKQNDHSLENVCIPECLGHEEPIIFYVYMYLHNLMELLYESGYYVSYRELLENNLLKI